MTAMVEVFPEDSGTVLWSVNVGDELRATGRWDLIDVERGLDEVIRSMHRAGASVHVRVFGGLGDAMGIVARRAVRRVLRVYEAVQSTWTGDGQ